MMGKREIGMADEAASADPRVVRTRLLLHRALEGLLASKDFAKISVGDVAEAATLNRATFYDHYPDKFALLECLVGERFNTLMTERGIVFASDCSAALRAMVLAVCDYLAATPRMGCERQAQLEPHLESAVIAVVRNMLLDGLRSHPTASSLPVEMIATAAAWAMYGGANQWLRTPDRCPSEAIADTIVALVAPILGAAAPVRA
jgi:AcrR family transcriptional regulator